MRHQIGWLTIPISQAGGGRAGSRNEGWGWWSSWLTHLKPQTWANRATQVSLTLFSRRFPYHRVKIWKHPKSICFGYSRSYHSKLHFWKKIVLWCLLASVDLNLVFVGVVALKYVLRCIEWVGWPIDSFEFTEGTLLHSFDVSLRGRQSYSPPRHLPLLCLQDFW